MAHRSVLRSTAPLVAILIGASAVITVPQHSPAEARPCVFHDIPRRRCPRPTTPAVTTTTTPAVTTTTAPAVTTTTAPAVTTTTAPTTTRPSEPSATTSPPGTPGPVTPGTQFTANFATPQDFFGRFQTQVFTGGTTERGTHTDWLGDHSMECGGPTTKRHIHHESHADDANLFWHCAPNGPDSGHLMTSFLTEGYGQVDFAPNRSFTNIRKVCWDQSMVGLPRKWVQVVVIPEALYQQNNGALNYGLPELQPVPAGDTLAIGPLPIEASTGRPMWPGRDAFNNVWAPQWDSFVGVFTVGSVNGIYSKQGNHADFGGREITDPAPRFRHCMTDLENGTMRFVIDLPGGTLNEKDVTLPGSLPNGPARVIFQDDTYDAFKADNPDPTGLNGGTVESTWHWDNITID